MPGKEPKSRSIGEHEYTVEPLGAVKGRSVLLRLSQIVGKSLSGISKDNWGEKLGDLLNSIKEDDLTYLCDEFGKKTMVSTPDGGALQLSKVFDIHFQDAYVEMLQWLAFCVECNYSSFFKGAAGFIKSAGSPAAVAKVE